MKPKMLRKRYIPNEVDDISNDEILFTDEKLIITKWNSIHPRLDFKWGISYYYLEDGIKISKIYKDNNEFLKYYCDILEYDYDKENNTYCFKDLLADVVVYPDGSVKVLDLDELAQALEMGLISQKQEITALKQLNNLLNLIYSGKFPPKEVLDDELLGDKK